MDPFITINSELNVYSQEYHNLNDQSEYLETENLQLKNYLTFWILPLSIT